MYLSLNLLKEYVDLPKSLTVEEIGKALTMHTVEVEGIENQAEKFEKVVVAKILEIRKHSNADRLQLAKVDNGGEILEIVCGAPNIEVGQLVPLAMVGAELPNGLVIKEAEVRGEKSCGMLCAADELGLGEDHSGIMILDKKAKVGQSLANNLNFNDTVLEVDNKSLSNRPDLWGHIGMARELSAIFNVKYKQYEFNEKVLRTKIEEKLNIEVQNKELCPRYMSVALSGIKVKESPAWLKEKLVATGLKPINNIVDITNFVMIELGQPMHAFDKKMVDNIVIRNAEEDEEVLTLDGEKRKLDSEMLVIADSNKVLAIAGIMGGESSEISNETTEIVLEVANFDYINIRKTSTKLGLRTEASMRFEKGLDPNLAKLALSRVVELIKEDCKEADIISTVTDLKNFQLETGPLEIDLNWIDKMIGEKIDRKRIIVILEKLGFIVEQEGEIIKVVIPTWRATRDIAIKEDVLEEVIRIYGFNNIKSTFPNVELKIVEQDELRLLERRIKDILIGAPALSEVYNYSFVGKRQLKKLGVNFDDYIKLLNPIASHQTMLRQNLAPNLIDNVKLNQARYDSFGLFEIGRVFLGVEGELRKSPYLKENLPYQEKRLGMVFAGKNTSASSAQVGIEIFSKAKGVVENLLKNLNLDLVFKKIKEDEEWMDKNCLSQIVAKGKNIGAVFLVSRKVGKNIGLKKEAVVVEIRLNDLLVLMKEAGVKKYEPFEKFPAIVRDLAFVVDSKMLYNEIRKEIFEFDELIKSVELFDVYEGDKLGENKKSLAFHIVYQSDRTLNNKEVDAIQDKLLLGLKNKFEASIRDF